MQERFYNYEIIIPKKRYINSDVFINYAKNRLENYIRYYNNNYIKNKKFVLNFYNLDKKNYNKDKN